jgi:CBS domain containing-hemolysin-like protein
MVHRHKRSGLILKELRANVDRPIAAILSLNTIANTAGAALAGAVATAVFGHLWLGFFSACFTLIILIFAEIIPKTAGVVYARSLAPMISLPLKWLVWVMTPAIWLCGLITGLITRHQKADSVSPDELRTMARLSLRLGGIMPYQESVIDNILSLGTTMIKDVMTPRTVISSLSEHLTIGEACRKTEQWEHSRLPVYDKDTEDIVGIVLTKELFMALAAGKENRPLTEIKRPARFVVETATLNKVLMEFMSSRQHLFVVIDEYGGLAGLISLEDILEEILGREIMDESDQVADKRDLAKQKSQKLESRPPKGH